MIYDGIQKIGLIIIVLFCAADIWCQTSENVLETEIQLSKTTHSISYYVDYLESEYDIVLSFNSNGINLEMPKIFDTNSMTLVDCINHLFEDYEFTAINRSDNKVLLVFSNINRPVSSLTIRGKVYDKNSGELLIGATIYESVSNVSTYTNEYGFYSLDIPSDSSRLDVHYIGFMDAVRANINQVANDFYLEFDNELSVVNITPNVNEAFVKGIGAEKLDKKKQTIATGVLGQADVLELTKTVAGVQSGNEGQTGLYVRGGSPDQNLILLDGIPLYEVSHAVGLSSIFIDEAVREVSLIKNGFPARYGGRLSSVLNIALKEGNKTNYHGSVKLAATNGNIHIEGPINKGKTSFSIAGKKSFLNLYLDDLYTKFTEYDGIGVDFYDVTAKISHNFSPSKKMTLSYYKGRDDFNLQRDERFTNSEDSFSSYVNNEVNWGSEVINAQFSNVIKDDFFVNFSLGGNRYDFLSRSSYSFESNLGGILTRKAEYDLRSITEIVDYIMSANVDYFATERHRLKFGGSYTFHQYKPAIQQNNILVDNIPDSVYSDDKIVHAEEFGLYVEDTYSLSDAWEIYMGLHLSGFSVEGDSYQNLQPRFKIVFQPDHKNRIEAAYTSTAQYVHLLVNPGTGLPSDLWVPTTRTIKPETAKQMSAAYTRVLNGNLKFSLGGYLKYMNNVLEYKSPVDLIFAVVNQIPTLDNTPWNERVEAGSATSRGLEFQMDFESEKWKSWLAYTWSKTDRLFANINDGQSFPYKYDRRHDLNIGVQFKINKNLHLMTNWVYGNGHLFSLSLEESIDVGGATIISPGKRNNYQLPSFHHLDVMMRYTKNLAGNQSFTINLGVYNLYSRLNGFYVYIFENPLEGKQFARKVSIYPILPQISFSYSF